MKTYEGLLEFGTRIARYAYLLGATDSLHRALPRRSYIAEREDSFHAGAMHISSRIELQALMP